MARSETRESSELDTAKPVSIETDHDRRAIDDGAWATAEYGADDDLSNDDMDVGALDRLTAHVFDDSNSQRAASLAGVEGETLAEHGDTDVSGPSDATPLLRPVAPHEPALDETAEATPLLRPKPPHDDGNY